MATSSVTLVKKITVGVHNKMLTGAAAQNIVYITVFDTSALTNDGILQFNSSSGKFEVTTLPQSLTFTGGSF